MFEKEQEERKSIKSQAQTIMNYLDHDPVKLRAEVPWMAGKSNKEIREMARRLVRLADSPHPMQGFWDSHGRIVDHN